MPPSTGRRTRTRKRAESEDKSDADDQVSVEVETPTRKRRRVNTVTPRQAETATAPASQTKTESQRRKGRSANTKVEDSEKPLTQAEVDLIVLRFSKGKQGVQARVDYANELHTQAHPEGKQAYAKIAGNGWTYYVDDLVITIGRPPDEKPAVPHTPAGVDGASGDNPVVHIDLGPSKLVSRQHAEIRYDEHSGKWCLTSTARNGVRVDEETLTRGMTEFLRSGSVIDIAGTQMMFVTPNDIPTIHPTTLARIRTQEEDLEDEDEVEFDLVKPPPRPQRTPTRAPTLHSGLPGKSSAVKDHPFAAQGQGGYGQFPSSSMAIMQHDGSADARGPGSLSAQKSPTYARGLMLESTEDIDYSVDSARDLKPPHSYAQLIGMAILSSSEEKLTLSKIYDWIKERYAFYRFSGGGWQNSIRHNLSLNKCFEKIARRTDEPGKGMKWQIVLEHRDEFIKKGLSNPRKGTGHSTGPNSPMYPIPSSTDPERRFDNAYSRDFHHEGRVGNPFVKTSPTSTPPVSAYPQMKLAYTPERGSAVYGQVNGIDPSSPRNPFASRMTPVAYGKHRTNGLAEIVGAMTPGPYTMLGGSDSNDHLYTPLITRHAPKLVPPSTARLPSHFMPLSSPAPFWKYAADYGSTPSWRDGAAMNLGLDMSPVKSVRGKAESLDEKETGVMKKNNHVDALAERPESSSPPPGDVEVGQGSPTRALSNRGRDTLPPQPEIHGAAIQPKLGEPSTVRPVLEPAMRLEPSVIPQDDNDEEEEEEGLIDLARGFQPIGSFHRSMNAGIIRG